jgi:hypothetical protein
MKYFKPVILLMFLLICGAYVSAQTADEIIGKYIQTMGGVEQLSKINSVYTESKFEVMGMEGIGKTTLLNGKGNRQDIDIMGNTMTTCYNDKGGWSLNPMTGSTTAEVMPDAQYKSGKDGIFVAGPFLDFSQRGYKAEVLGNETVDSINAVKIKVTSPDTISTVYLFDTVTGHLIKALQQMEVQGQMTDIEVKYSDFRQTDGFTMPYKMEMFIPTMQFSMTNTVTKVELNNPVDEAIFAKP